MITTNSTPELSRDGFLSQWNAAWNPVLFEFSFSIPSPFTLEYLTIRVYDSFPTLIATVRAYPDQTGRVKVNISPYINSGLVADNTTEYLPALGQEQEGTFENFYLEVERQDGTGTVTTDTFFVADAVRQAGDPDNGNLFTNVAEQMVSSPEASTTAEFMTSFEHPTYFVGYPFDLWIINRNGTRATALEYNGITPTTQTDYIIGTPNLIGLTLPEPQPTTDTVELWIEYDDSFVDNVITEDSFDVLTESGALVLID